ncbi:MAG: 3-dehydroquinate synthase [Pseudomonadota bacterium]
MIKTVKINLPGRDYDVRIGSGLTKAAAQHIAPFLKRPFLAVVSDAHVWDLHGQDLRAAFDHAGIRLEILTVPQGEVSKSWAQLQRVTEWLLAIGIERRDLIVAFGGGVIGDLVGFAAAILRRGVGFVQIPTSLLAQVDSSVGGKTGINSPLGKNLVGSFHQPKLVLADIDVLGTLSARDFLAGYGEVAKYGLLGSADFFEWLEANGPTLATGDIDLRQEAVRKSVQMKADIVERDEKESGDRALLNLGHTFCHALEAATGYSDRLLHGEGVSIGCALAFETSMRLGLCSQEAPSRVRAHLRAMGMKTDLSDIQGDLPDPQALIALMGQDKKVVDGNIRFIMARDIGQAFVTDGVDLEVVASVLKDAY